MDARKHSSRTRYRHRLRSPQMSAKPPVTCGCSVSHRGYCSRNTITPATVVDSSAGDNRRNTNYNGTTPLATVATNTSNDHSNTGNKNHGYSSCRRGSHRENQRCHSNTFSYANYAAILAIISIHTSTTPATPATPAAQTRPRPPPPRRRWLQ